MNMQANKPLIPKHTSTSSRIALAAVLLAVLALAVLAGSALAANLVKNGSFEKDSDGDGIPNGWSTNALSAADKQVCNQSYAGDCSFKMAGPGSSKRIWQTISSSGGAGDTYTFTIWLKTKDVVQGGGTTELFLEIHQVDGGGDLETLAIAGGTAGWQKFTLELTSSELYDSVKVRVDFFPDSGKAWFDKVKLVGP